MLRFAALSMLARHTAGALQEESRGPHYRQLVEWVRWRGKRVSNFIAQPGAPAADPPRPPPSSLRLGETPDLRF